MYRVTSASKNTGKKQVPVSFPDQTFETLSELDDFMDANYPDVLYSVDFAWTK